MQNKKVYLAKSNLASGLDYEYVKSSLLRIPDIEIIEYGDGIEPSECACFVYIPHNTFNLYDNNGKHLFVNKNVFNDVLNYTDNENRTNPLDTIFIYLGKSSNTDSGDIEFTSPFILRTIDFDTVLPEAWDTYGVLSFDSEEADSLLKFVNHCVDNSDDDWLNNPRHYAPENQYAMPPIPSLDKRRSRGTTRITTKSVEIKTPDKIYQDYKSEDLISGKKPRRRR